MWAELHQNVKIRIINSFLSRMVGGAVFPFMAIYFSQHLGAGTAGLLLMVLVGIEFVAGLYGGGLADAWGRRRTLLSGQVLAVAGFTALLLANLWTPLPWYTFGALSMIYVANGLINPAAEAMLVDVSTPESRTFMYAVNYWAINISILIGTLLGGWFYQDHFTALLTGLLGVSFVTLFLAWRFMMETLSRPVTTESRQGISFFALLTNYGQVIKDRKFMLFLAAFVLMMSIEFGRSNAIPVHLAQHFTPLTVAGLQLTGVKAMSLLTAVNTLMVVALTIPVSNWVKRHDLQSVMLWGTALYAGGFVALYGLTDLTVLLIASIVLTMGELLYVPSRQTLLADMIPEDRRGAYLAVSGQVFTVAKWLAVLGIPLSAAIGGIAMMIVVGLLGVGSILLARRSV